MENLREVETTYVGPNGTILGEDENIVVSPIGGKHKSRRHKKSKKCKKNKRKKTKKNCKKSKRSHH